MPYEITKPHDSEYCVVNPDTGETVSCHGSMDDAQAHMNALYANVEDASKGVTHITHDMLITFGDVVKAVDNQADSIIVEGYLIRYTHTNKRDLDNEYFTSDTDTYKGAYPLVGKPVLYQHGLDDKLSVIPIGEVIASEYRDDGIYIKANIKLKDTYTKYLAQAKMEGLDDPDGWLKQQIEIADEYEKRLRYLIENGKIGWSSGALPQSYKSEDGHIKSWAIIEASLTPSPAMPIETRVMTVKALNSVIQRDEQREAEAVKTAPNASGESKQNDNHILKNEDKQMTTKMMSASELREYIGMAFDETRDMLIETLIASMDYDEDDAMAMVTSVEDDAKAELENDKEMKAFFVDGQAPTENIKGVLAKRAPKTFMKHIKSKIQRDRENKEALKAELQAEMDTIKADAPPVSRVSGNSEPVPNTTSKSKRVEVGDNLKYAHLSAEDMLYGYLAMKTRIDPVLVQRGIHPVTDEYLTHMTHKSAMLLDRKKFDDIKDDIAVKSVFPYKADEIDATNIAGQGTEWVSTLFGSTIWEKARSPLSLLGIMERKGMFMQPIPQGHGSVKIPTEAADPIAYSTPEANDLDATNRVEVTANIGFFGTGNVTLTPGQIKIAAAPTDELIEDSIIPVLPQMQRQMTRKALETIEQALINGDTTTTQNNNINLNDGTPGTGINRPYYLAVDGLRHYPLVTNTAYARDAGNDLALDDYRLLLQLFGAPVQADRERLLFLTDVYTENASLALPEIQTDDVRRTNATISSGRVINLYGVENYVSGFLGKSGATGTNSGTPANNTRGQILAVYAPYWAFGWKRDVTFETQREILSGVTVAVASMRFGFVARGADASAITHNVGLS